MKELGKLHQLIIPIGGYNITINLEVIVMTWIVFVVLIALGFATTRKRGILPMMDLLTVDDFRGSSHIIAMSRSVMGLSIIKTGPEPDRNGPRRLEIVKTNLARYPQPLGMELKPLHPKGVWLEYASQPPAPYKQPTKIDECADWLLCLLDDAGATRPQEIVEQAEASGFSRRTVYRARSKLGDRIADTEGHKHPELTEFYYNQVITKARETLRAFIDRGVERGELRPTALRDFPQLLIAPVLVAIVWRSLFERHHHLDTDKLLATHIDLLVEAIRAPQASGTGGER